MKKIAIFGSTGSIGSSLLKIIKDDKKILKLNYLQQIKIIRN
jgi:1-deoxy-D-xylulose-5-phosphate reductoisomerase